jgi:Leucine-rich repeat (LRR) protein
MSAIGFRNVAVCALALGLSSLRAQAESPVLTNALRSGESVTLQWSSPTNRNIVGCATTLLADAFAFVTPVLTDRVAMVTNAAAPVFYRVQRVAVVATPDPGISNALWGAITSKTAPTNELYDFETAAITNLSLINKGITNLTGLDYTALASLNLSLNSDLRDLSPLAGLTTLRRLEFLSNQITNLSPLAGLTNLWSLEFPDNQVSDLGPLSNLTALVRLYIFGNQVADLSPLSGLTNLEQLLGADNLIVDVEPLAGLTRLEDLRLEANSISDLSPLAGLTNLSLLYLTSNQVVEIGALVTNRMAGGLASGAVVRLRANPLSDYAKTNDIPFLTNQGVSIQYDP